VTFIYEVDPYSLKIHRICKNKLRTSRLSKVTACECVHLVRLMRGHFRSRDKDGGHAIRSVIPEKHATCKPDGCMFYTTGVVADRSFTLREAGNRDICSCDLDLDPMPFIYELHPYFLEIC